MTWVLKGDMLLDIDNPARSVDINAIYDNMEAMANGDAGAPKIQPIALDPSITLLIQPTSGDVVTQAIFGYTLTPPSNYGGQVSQVLGSVFVSGNARLSFDWATGTNTNLPTTANAQVIVNGVTKTFEQTSSGSDFIDFPIAKGGTISITVKNGLGDAGSIPQGYFIITVDNMALKTGEDSTFYVRT